MFFKDTLQRLGHSDCFLSLGGSGPGFAGPGGSILRRDTQPASSETARGWHHPPAQTHLGISPRAVISDLPLLCLPSPQSSLHAPTSACAGRPQLFAQLCCRCRSPPADEDAGKATRGLADLRQHTRRGAALRSCPALLYTMWPCWDASDARFRALPASRSPRMGTSPKARPHQVTHESSCGSNSPMGPCHHALETRY